MSDAGKGAQRVRAVEDKLHAHGFRTMLASRSGQRRGVRAASLALDGDLIAIAPQGSRYPHMIVEVGGLKKSVAQTVREMTAQGPLPGGFIPVVVRLVKSAGSGSRWRWHAGLESAHDSLGELLDAVSP